MVGAGCDEEAIKRGQYRLRKQAAPLGFQLIPYRTGDVPWESDSPTCTRLVLHFSENGVNQGLAPVLRLKNSGNDHQALV